MSVLDSAGRLKQDVGSLLESMRMLARESGGAASAFHRLLLADLSLARAGMVRALVLLLVCVLILGTAWLVAMAMLVVGLHQLGLSWLLSLLVPLLASLAAAWACWAWAFKSLALAELQATRRQLATWFPETPPVPAASPGGAIDPDQPNPEADSQAVAPKSP